MLTRSRHLLPKPHPFLPPPSPVIASLSLRTPAARFPQFRALTSSGGVRFTLAASMDAYPGAPSVRNGAAGLEFEEMDKFAEVANMLADAAGAVIRQYFRKSFDVQDKEDLSPVTIADQKAEEAMVSILLEKLPLHAVFGEESGWRCARESADYVWVLDPIDGTKSFITGKPLFGTLIALLHNGEPILGVIDQPVLRERWIGIRGKCTTLNGQEVSTRTCSKLSQAYLYTTSPHLFKGDAEEAFARVRSKVKVPLYGCDCYAYALLASGYVDLVVESGLKPYDFLSLVPVIEGAGGAITDWKGRPLRWEALPDSYAPSFNVVAAGDKNLLKQALDSLQWN
uniref:histidinol-phosphatase n=1 Tax=Kalanchoe fedtschenkoi TaxID=63787 RepID=A0A7N0ZWR2_KALFE